MSTDKAGPHRQFLFWTQATVHLCFSADQVLTLADVSLPPGSRQPPGRQSVDKFCAQTKQLLIAITCSGLSLLGKLHRSYPEIVHGSRRRCLDLVLEVAPTSPLGFSVWHGFGLPREFCLEVSLRLQDMIVLDPR